MIILIVGKNGSGKSYEVVNFHIIPALLEGRRVRTNIPLNIEHITSVYGREVASRAEVLEMDYEKGIMPFEKLSHYASPDDDEGKEDGTGLLIVIDEAQLVFPAGESDFNKAVWKLATMHRHFGQDWILCTQDVSFIYQKISKLVVATHRFVKCLNIGQPTHYRHIVYDGFSTKDLQLSNRKKKYKPELFSFYKSHTGRKGAVDEVNIVRSHFNFGLLIKFLLGLLLFVIVGVFYFFYSIYDRYNVSHETSSIESLDKPIGDLNQNPPISVGASAQTFNNISVDGKSVITEVKLPIVKNVYDKPVLANKIKDVKRAPFDSYIFSIKGGIKKKKNNIDLSFYDIYDEQGGFITMSSDELRQLGYTISVASRCVHILDHENQSDALYVTCHVPTFKDERDRDANQSMTVANANATERAVNAPKS